MSIDMDDTEQARICHCQGILFPQSARELSDAIGLNWWTAIKLHEEGWLSFDPKNVAPLNESQEHELRFVGSLVSAGCDHQMLSTLLEGLVRPYCYDTGRLYYDWAGRRWRLLPKRSADPDPEEIFDNWLACLDEDRDVARLEELSAQVKVALKRVRINRGEA